MNPWTGGSGWTVFVDATSNVAGTCSRTGATVTATTSIFGLNMIGRTITVDTIGNLTISAYVSATQVTVSDVVNDFAGKTFTISQDDAAVLVADGGDVYYRGGLAGSVHITRPQADVWDITVTCHHANGLVGVWIPWMGTKITAELTAKIFNTRLLGLEHDSAVAKTLNDAGPTNWMNADFNWQGDEQTDHRFPGDFWFAGLGYDTGSLAYWIGLVDTDKSVRPLFSRGRLSIQYDTLIANGNLLTATGASAMTCADDGATWTTPAGWAIAAGKATAAVATNDSLTYAASDPLVVGQTYLVTYTMTRTAGDILAFCGGANGQTRSTTGTHVDKITCTVNGTFKLSGLVYVGDIDDVYVTNVTSGKTFRVYIGEDLTATNARERIGKLVRTHGILVTRPAGPTGDAWHRAKRLIDVQLEDQDDPEGWTYDLWDRQKANFGAIVFWGQMSFRTPSSALTANGVYDSATGVTTITALEDVFEASTMVGTTLTIKDSGGNTVDSFPIASVTSKRICTATGDQSFTSKRLSTANTGCCLLKTSLHDRNLWLRTFAEEVKLEGKLVATYTRPLDIAEADASKALEWARCTSKWCNAVYIDKAAIYIAATTFGLPNLLIERGNLLYPDAALVSGSNEGGGAAHSKRGTAPRDDLGSTYVGTDPGASRPHGESSYVTEAFTKTAFWIGCLFRDAVASTVRPVKFFLGYQNGDANDPDWTFSQAFMTGCGIAPRFHVTTYDSLITQIITQEDAVDLYAGGWQYWDRIGCSLTTPSSGVDFRRFKNAAGTASLLRVDQMALGLSEVIITVDGTPRTVQMVGGRLKSVVI